MKNSREDRRTASEGRENPKQDTLGRTRKQATKAQGRIQEREEKEPAGGREETKQAQQPKRMAKEV